MLVLTLVLAFLQSRLHKTFLPNIFFLDLLEVNYVWFLTLTVTCSHWSGHWFVCRTRFCSFLHPGHDLYPLNLFFESAEVIDVGVESLVDVLWLCFLFFLPDETSFLSIGMHSPLLYVINYNNRWWFAPFFVLPIASAMSSSPGERNTICCSFLFTILKDTEKSSI